MTRASRPHIKEYVRGFADSFTDGLKGLNVLFMQSMGLTPMNISEPRRSLLVFRAGLLLAGPAVQRARSPNPRLLPQGRASRHDANTAAVRTTHVADCMNTVAAGRASMLHSVRAGLLLAGPQSAGRAARDRLLPQGADPYRHDANLLLGTYTL
ncbi:unnamed protein product [Chrysodeixis includens]|uniref:Uncharacterized protein n=1 Tax=Chrysodeixis includens TaxID=689277 RepID=A0A9N8PZV7_CHRIL|nr:unnamed protein product [Chrysodeixis includens]